MTIIGRISDRLRDVHPALFNGYAASAAFATYFCMYAFRKPFAAAKYGDVDWGSDVEFKTALVIAQILGYAASKYLGIKVCSEASRGRRAALLVGLILAAEAALVLFAVVPPRAKVVALFLNGLPLGMVWGLVVRYLEGRQTSELLLAVLSCSFIVSSGVVKDVGRALLAGTAPFGIEMLVWPSPVPEFWMPAATGLMFLAPFLAAVGLLELLPEPSPLDVAERMQRPPLDGSARRRFLRRFFPGIASLVACYMLLTAFRDYRDNYMVDVLDELQGAGRTHPQALSAIETSVAIAVLAVMACLFAIKNHRRALATIFGIMFAGAALLGCATALWRNGAIDGSMWVTLLGLGVYLAYVPFNALLFDRIMASTRFAGTAVFAIYVADSAGYSGSVAMQLYKDLYAPQASRSEFLAWFAGLASVVGLTTLAAAGLYFDRKSASVRTPSHVDGTQHSLLSP
ncbi:MAG TPA: DUF5690 family protein [Lacipirellulaceae bacterium]|nr:DUF5690 family protein [Lacipirellulaceae bacterium]HMP06874.1 DUF5690 family protein [Lacipirellulaceae bacterium]